MKNALVALSLIILMSTSVLLVFPAAGTIVTMTLPDQELSTQFTKAWGPAAVAIADVPGPGVQFDFSGLTGDGTGVSDNYPVSQLAGGALDNIGGYGDFRGYTQYRLVLTNLGPSWISANIFMNTGWTVPDPTRDTYWENGWVYIEPSKSKVITLDFSDTICHHASDDPILGWQYPDGTSGVAIRRLSEVSNIGFQVCGAGDSSVVVSSATSTLDVDVPLTLTDAELGTQLSKEIGPATLTITDVPEPGVLFQFSGLTSTKTIVSDNFPVSALAGGSTKDYGSGFAGPYDFSEYTYYGLAFTNVGSTSVDIKLKMNTGWTVPPWGSPQSDTYWQGPWTTIAPLETRLLTLDFWSAEAWNAADDPVLAWQYPDGTSGVIVRRLDETSNIGFEIKGSGDAAVKVMSFFDVFLSLSDEELGTQFARESGPGTVAITDITGPGVRFDFTGLNPSSGTIVGDNFAVSQLAGGAYKTYGVTQQFSTWGDFSAYTEYRMIFTNLGTEPVTVCLKLNTGYTTPPPEYAEAWRDTYWQSQWTEIAPGASTTVILDFSSAQVWNAGDEQEHDVYPGGTTGIAIWRLDEVSDIGFQILGDGEASVILSAEAPVPPEAPTASFTFSPPSPKVGEVVTFDASGSTPNGGSIISYEWDFGDGNITTVGGSAIIHVYGAASVYTVILTVEDSEGLSDSTSAPVTVVPAILPAYAYLTVEPEMYSTNRRGTFFTIDVTLNNITEDMRLVGVEFKIQFNTTLLKAINATEGPFLKGFGGDPHQGTFFSYVVKYDYIVVGIAILPDVHGAYHFFPSGMGTLASITFKAIYQHMNKTRPPLTSGLHLYQTKLADDTGVPPGIPHYTEDGFYEIYPTVFGDVNYDRIVDIFDCAVIGLAFGYRPPSPNYQADADINGDLIVDIFDLVVVALHFGEDP